MTRLRVNLSSMALIWSQTNPNGLFNVEYDLTGQNGSVVWSLTWVVEHNLNGQTQVEPNNFIRFVSSTALPHGMIF
jgi:hypothetical protein